MFEVNAYGCQLRTDDKDEQRYISNIFLIDSLLWGELIEEEELEEEGEPNYEY